MISKQYEELEDLYKKDPQLMYSRIKQMKKPKRKSANTAIKGKNGKVLFEKEQVLNRWGASKRQSNIKIRNLRKRLSHKKLVWLTASSGDNAPPPLTSGLTRLLQFMGFLRTK